MLTDLGVEFGQGYLIGRPSYEPQAPRPMADLRLDARATVARRVRDAVPKRTPRRATAK